MAYTRKSLRRMSPEQRRVAKLYNEAQSLTRKLKGLIDTMGQVEQDSRALANAKGGPQLVKIEAAGRLAHGWPHCPHCGEEVKPERASTPDEQLQALHGLGDIAERADREAIDHAETVALESMGEAGEVAL